MKFRRMTTRARWMVGITLGLLAAAALGLLVCSGFLERAMPPKDPLPVLMYHHLVKDGMPCNSMTVTESRMEQDLRWLKENGYQTVLPRELAAELPRQEKTVMLTFDDGYRSNYELLFPLLKKYQMKAAIAVIVKKVDDGSPDTLTWDMCREMERSGLVEIGSHTYALHNLDNQGNFRKDGPNGIARVSGESDVSFVQRVLVDLQKSHQRIVEELGEVTFFAYPYGIRESDATAFIEKLFPVTLTTERRVADLTKGIKNLPRIAVRMEVDLGKIL